MAGNLYVQSLLDPRRSGAKVPDSYAARTCTVQLETTATLTNVSVGAAHYLGCILTVGTLPYYGQPAGSPLQWAGSGWLDPQTDPLVPATANSRLQSLFCAARVVSASVRFQFTGTSQNNQGTVTLFTLGRTELQRTLAADVGGGPGTVGNPDLSNTQNIPDFGGFGQDINASQIRDLPNNAFGPVKDGGMVRWFPQDNRDTEFRPISVPTVDSPSSGLVGMIGVLCEGVDSTASGIVELIVNLECIPKSDSFHLVSASASPIDANAMAAAQRVVAVSPSCVVSGGRSRSMRY